MATPYRTSQDIEDLASKYTPFVRDLVSEPIKSEPDYRSRIKQLRKRYRQQPSKSEASRVYHHLLDQNQVVANSSYEHYGVRKMVRASSGVLVITVFTSAYPETKDGRKGRFDCQYDCHYCPSEPGQPRSYLSTEPGVRRAIQYEYDCLRQFTARLMDLISCGHTPDKLEVLVLGGTWSSYPRDYQEKFISDIYYAANTFQERLDNGFRPADKKSTLNQAQTIYRAKKSLLEERRLNETLTSCRIIGITLETRPDCVNEEEIRRFRSYGCTRVQIGVQHTDDQILRKVNRKCYLRDTIRAIRLLKETGFKVDIHLMPDLPGATPEIDRQMFQLVLSDPDLQADQWKIYPTSVTPFTQIEKWYLEKDPTKYQYRPYAETHFDQFVELLIWVKTQVPPYIRLNRVIRDIPNESIIGGNQTTHLRNILNAKLTQRGLRCMCIRCREVKGTDQDLKPEEAFLHQTTYRASGGIEYYLSYENVGRTKLYGQLRLRINQNPSENIFPELRNAAIIRELHVYGRLISVSDRSKYRNRAQHQGFGRRLLQEAERITRQAPHNLQKIAVISGDGVKPYYRRFDYRDDGEYLVKDLRYQILWEKIKLFLLYMIPVGWILLVIGVYYLLR